MGRRSTRWAAASLAVVLAASLAAWYVPVRAADDPDPGSPTPTQVADETPKPTREPEPEPERSEPKRPDPTPRDEPDDPSPPRDRDEPTPRVTETAAEPTPAPVEATPVAEDPTDRAAAPTPQEEPSDDPRPTEAAATESAPELSAVPEASAAPEQSAVPEESATPDTSAEPDLSGAPDASAMPDPSAMPEESATPDTSAEPDPSAVPSVIPSAAPEASVAPEPSPSIPTIECGEPFPSGPPASEAPEPLASLGPLASQTPVEGPDPSPAPGCDTPAPSASPEPSPIPSAPAPRVWTNKDDYAPGSLVIVEGSGWAPAEEVALAIDDDEGRSWHEEATVLARDDGSLSFEFRLPDRFVATYTISARGPISGATSWRFTDSIGTGPSTNGDNGTTPASEITLATPAAASGRLLVATIVVDGLDGGDVVCAPGGWTLAGTTSITNSVSVRTYHRLTNGSEAASYTWLLRNGALWCFLTFLGHRNLGAVGAITAYAGIDTGNPVVSVTGASGSGTSIAAPSVAGVAANSIVIRAFGSDRANAITVAGASSTGVANQTVFSIRRAGPAAPAAAAADADQTTAGASGTLTASSGGAGDWVAQTIVLRMASTQPILELTIGDGTAQFGTNLGPDGAASDSTDSVTLVLGTAGACYVWPGSVAVRSSLPYDVTVTAATANDRIDFLVANPADYAACTGGEQLGPSMFPGATPPRAWVTNQAATTTPRTHPYRLGLDVRWTDPPSATVASGTITLEAKVRW